MAQGLAEGGTRTAAEEGRHQAAADSQPDGTVVRYRAGGQFLEAADRNADRDRGGCSLAAAPEEGKADEACRTPHTDHGMHMGCELRPQILLEDISKSYILQVGVGTHGVCPDLCSLLCDLYLKKLVSHTLYSLPERQEINYDTYQDDIRAF